ncbi:MAG: prolyl oligopeptidase family serine peptidase [Caldilineaceae bacterium]
MPAALALTYPETRTSDQVDDYHGTAVADPYRWLEDTDSPETQAWVAAQNALTQSFLSAIPGRAGIHKRLTQLWDYPRLGIPTQRRGRYFQTRNSGLQNQDVLMVMDTADGEGRILLDPNTLSDDGTKALTNWAVSPDGRWLAYAISSSGSDWMTWHVRDVESGDDLPDEVEWSKFSGAEWLPDSSGFFYSRYAAPQADAAYQSINYHQQLYLHRIGQSQAQDVLVYARPEQKEWGFRATVSDDARWLILHVWQGTDTRNRLFFGSLAQALAGQMAVTELIPELEAKFHFVGNDGSLFYFETDWNAPTGQLIGIDIETPQREKWQSIVPGAKDTLAEVRLVEDTFLALYMHDAHHRLLRFDRTGQTLGEIELPTLGSVVLGTPRRRVGVDQKQVEQKHIEQKDNEREPEIFYSFSSFAWPTSIYRFSLTSQANQLLAEPEIDFDFDRFTTRQAFATSADGTQVPYFLVQRADLADTGPWPTLLYGYGGFDISLTPGFAISRLVWLEMGGALVVANLRGGGEYGQEWHKAGMLSHKQRVFDDFIGVAEALIAEGITSPEKLAIQGGSNGGLLVGAAMTQRPELFGAAVPGVGVMDMLRFHKFTIGWAWVPEYGSSDDPEQFATLYAYSPLQNLRPGVCYPPTLVTTGDHDDRVVPGHSFKFAATLQAVQGCDNPTLIRIQQKAGHGAGKPTAILIDEISDVWAFLAWALGMEQAE